MSTSGPSSVMATVCSTCAALTPDEHERGGSSARPCGRRGVTGSMVAVASAVGVSPETLRKIESGRVPTPPFFTVAALAQELGVPLGELAEAATTTGSRPLSAAR